MGEADIRKLRELSKKYTILCKVFCGVYKVDEIHPKKGTVSAGGISINLAETSSDNFFVSIPLSQINKGLQPQ
jgi:hypothetical protein